MTCLHKFPCDREECRIAKRRETRTTIMLAISIAALIVLLKLLHAYLFYGHLSCAFAECRKEITEDAR